MAKISPELKKQLHAIAQKQAEKIAKEFEDKMKDHPNYDEAYAFIYWKDGVLPLYRGQQNYIVSENGATYSNLTYK